MHWGVFNLEQVTVKRHMKEMCSSDAKKVAAYKGMAMHTHAVERYKGTFQSFPLLYAGKKSQPDARIMHTSVIIMSTC